MALLHDVTIGAIGDDPQKHIESVVRQVNEWGRALSNEDRTSITKDDAGDARLLIGYQEGGFANGNVGAKLSQEGVDVQSATDNQLVWSTDFNSFKIVSSGSATIPSPGAQVAFTTGVSTITVTHGLGYIPAYVYYPLAPAIYFNGTHIIDNARLFGNNSWAGNATGDATYGIGAAANSTDIVFYNVWGTGASGGTPLAIDVSYYLFKETAS